jgi:hypothetical protein
MPLAEIFVGDQEVGGSNPPAPTGRGKMSGLIVRNKGSGIFLLSSPVLLDL